MQLPNTKAVSGIISPYCCYIWYINISLHYELITDYYYTLIPQLHSYGIFYRQYIYIFSPNVLVKYSSFLLNMRESDILIYNQLIVYSPLSVVNIFTGLGSCQVFYESISLMNSMSGLSK